MRASGSLLLLVLAVVVGCTADAGDEVVTATVTDAEAPTEVRLGDAGLVVPPGAAPTGTVLSAFQEGTRPPAGTPDVAPVPPVVLSASEPFDAPVTVEVPVDPELLADAPPEAAGMDPVAYVFDEDSAGWLPQPSTYDAEAGVVRAETTHLSRWTWGHPRYWLGRALRDRSAELVCDDPEPSWVDHVVGGGDINSSVFSCIEREGDDARIVLRSNRGGPVLLAPSQALAVVGGDRLSRVLTRGAFGATPSLLLLRGGEELHLRVQQPEQLTTLTLTRADGTRDRLAMYLLDDLVATLGSDTVIGDVATCVGTVIDTAEVADDGSVTQLIAAVESSFVDCVQTRLETLEALGLITDTTHRRLRSAIVYLDFGTHFAAVLDATLMDRFDDVVLSAQLAGWAARPGVTSVADGPRATDPPAVLLVIDVSGSMNATSNGTVRIDAAREAVLQVAESLDDDARLGVRTYPAPGGTDDLGCSPGQLDIPLQAPDVEELSALARRLTASGNTPTASALLAAADDLERAGVRDATIVLISDGESNCGPPPCDVVPDLVDRGFDVVINTLSLDLAGSGRDDLDCIAAAGAGIAVDVEGADRLADEVAAFTSPRLTLDVDHPERIAAAAGIGAGALEITATVANAGRVQADDVQVALVFDADAAPLVLSPRRRLGNLGPDVAVDQTWTVTTPRSAGGRELDFTVQASGSNVPVVEHEGRIDLDGEVTLDDAGPVLRDASQVAIVGDSYSSGEGAGDYLPGTFGPDSPWCHQSLRTYGRALWGDDDRELFACSGAVSLELEHPNQRFSQEVPPQLDTLRERMAEGWDPEAVLMTLGGNDIGFERIIKACIVVCVNEVVLTVGCEGAGCEASLTSFETWVMDNIAGLPASLRRAYLATDRAVNGAGRAEARGRPTPIVVLGYVSSVPRNPEERSRCSRTFTRPQLALLGRVVDALNQTLGDTVDELRARGVPIVFVPEVQDAFLPANTYCDDEPFVRTLSSADVPEPLIVELRQDLLAQPSVSVVPNVDVDGYAEALREVIHPTEDGYRAVTDALVRWSQTDAAQAPLERTYTDDLPEVVPTPRGELTVSPDDAAQRLQPASSYELLTSGHAPGGSVEVRLRSTPRLLGVSTADEQGRARTTLVVPPDVAAGTHHLEVAAEAPDGTFGLQRTPVEVVRRGWLPGAIAVGVGLLLLAVTLVLRRRSTVDG